MTEVQDLCLRSGVRRLAIRKKKKKKSGLSWGFLFSCCFSFFWFCSQSNHLSNVNKINSSTRSQINTLYHLCKVLVLRKVKITSVHSAKQHFSESSSNVKMILMQDVMLEI